MATTVTRMVVARRPPETSWSPCGGGVVERWDIVSVVQRDWRGWGFGEGDVGRVSVKRR